MRGHSLLLGMALLVFSAPSMALDQDPPAHGQQARGPYKHDRRGWSGPHAKAHKHHVCWHAAITESGNGFVDILTGRRASPPKGV